MRARVLPSALTHSRLDDLEDVLSDASQPTRRQFLARVGALYKQPKVRRRGVAKPPLKELGADPETKRAIIIKDGRFGMYVTDGETNATLRRGDTVEAMTIERALELLAGRRAWEIENGGVSKKPKRAKKSAPTLTGKTIKGAGSKRKAKKLASGKSNKVGR